MNDVVLQTFKHWASEQAVAVVQAVQAEKKRNEEQTAALKRAGLLKAKDNPVGGIAGAAGDRTCDTLRKLATASDESGTKYNPPYTPTIPLA